LIAAGVDKGDRNLSPCWRRSNDFIGLDQFSPMLRQKIFSRAGVNIYSLITSFWFSGVFTFVSIAIILYPFPISSNLNLSKNACILGLQQNILRSVHSGISFAVLWIKDSLLRANQGKPWDAKPLA
jgi:hypothetical protein